MDKQDLKNLKKRYVLWLYKMTKEAFDRFERKFTQLEVDVKILEVLEKELKEAYLPNEKSELEKYVNEFRNYIDQKQQDSIKLKYKGKKINAEFIFLDAKLNAIESIIKAEFGKDTLQEIKALYEEEMMRRIVQAVEEKR
jgi:hypothetical protein